MTVSSQANQFVVKYSDDTITFSLLTNNSDSHKVAVDKFVDWFDTVHQYMQKC